MYKSIRQLAVATAAAATSLLAACTSNASTRQQQQEQPHSVAPAKAVVCYFSATGTTADAARRIARLAGADIHEITPETPYTAADLDWRDSLSRSYVEMHNRSMRPAIKDAAIDADAYDVIFLGYPNWWNTAPTVINTFVEANTLKGKTVVPFMTSGGSGITNSEDELHEAYPGISWKKGLLVNDVTDQEINDWIEDAMR